MYDTAHRALLRTLMSKGVLTVPDANKLLREHTGAAPSVEEYVRSINDKIRPFQQSIKLVMDELTNEEALVFMSLGFDDITKAQQMFTQTELQYFRVLLERILAIDRRQISAIAALNLVSNVKGTISKHDAEKLLSKWCAMRYLDIEDDQYRLGLRSVHEFEAYVRRNMPDALEECSLCKQIVFRGCNCPMCSRAVHTRCLERFLERVNTWPCCKSEYTGLPDPADVTHRSRQTDVTASHDTSEAGPSHAGTEPESSRSESPDLTQPDCTQASQLGISQSSAVRKRKRQLL